MFRGAIRDDVSFYKRNSMSTCIKPRRLETNLVDFSVLTTPWLINGNLIIIKLTNN